MTKRPDPTFQSIVLSLHQFWADQGCVIWHPYHTEVGAGTMNPATVLRVLGPEPWRVGYLEPSIRPDDGRYGENPNRMQHFYQYQVILKPDPGNPQELYLESLVALGIDPQQHDIRFVEDNWESPAIGAWGLGWEVWLDGLEITQFTYFQQAGGHVLDPVSVELTYGLERILMALQGCDHFANIQWTRDRTYGDLNLQGEVEFSRYFFETADVERLRSMYQEFEEEANSALQSGLVLPALDYILKCSQTFNILDTRGAIGVAERAALFGRIRELSRGMADAYLEGREALGFPWLSKESRAEPASGAAERDLPRPENAATFLLEVGTEELPSADLETALEQLEESVPALLGSARLEHGQVKILGTPRRLVVLIDDLAAAQDERVMEVKGPPTNRAFDQDGKPTKAAKGFARSQGIAVDQLVVRQMNGGSYAMAPIREPGLPAAEVLEAALPELIGKLRFDRSMRWNESGVSFSRPVRWLLAMHGEHALHFEFAGIWSGTTTRSLRFHDPASMDIKSPEAYLNAMDELGIVLDVGTRRETIWDQVTSLAESVGGTIAQDPALLVEVANLVEKPIAVLGAFEDQFLSLPPQVLISVMKKHQRYFPVETNEGLLPYFVAVSNGGAGDLERVTAGNEMVVKARFVDAAYFVRQDLQEPLEAYLPHLGRLTFHADLGSMLDKTERLVSLVPPLGEALGLSTTDLEAALRGAQLSKADLATRMVVDMTSLQGTIGRDYALRSGEKPEVAQAIYEHYLPRFAGEELPASRPGLVVGLADRLDTLMGLFAVGLQPTGTKDPYALRRTAIGLVQVLIGLDLRFDLRTALQKTAALLPVEVPAETQEECLRFITARQQSLLLSGPENHRHDAVEAVLAVQAHDPAGASQAVRALEGWIERGDWPLILQAYARCARIVRAFQEQFEVDPQLFAEEQERNLYRALQEAQSAPCTPGSVDDFLSAFETMVPAITEFFDHVLVMADEESLRTNRLGLLQRIVSMAANVADLSRLEGF